MNQSKEESKPVGWWCPKCDTHYTPHGTPGLCAMRGALCCCTDTSPDKREIYTWTECVPCFKPLDHPEPSHETWATIVRSAKVLTTVDEIEEVRFATPKDLGPRGCGIDAKRWATLWVNDRWDLHGDQFYAEEHSDADAVLWVVEGLNPEQDPA